MKLVKVEFFDDVVVEVCELSQTAECMNKESVFRVTEVLNKIITTEAKRGFEVDPNWLYQTEPKHKCWLGVNDSVYIDLNKREVVAQFNIDCDEADTYFVTKD